jgi:ABC-2 type transport system ATP-binding protein
MMSENIVEIKNVSKKYGMKEGVQGLSFSIPSGGIVGLIGSNGSGKTTLMKMIAGLLQPTRGEIFVANQKVTRMICQKVAFLSEQDSLYSFYTVGSTLKFANSVFPDFRLDKAREMLQFLRLDEKQYVKHLSKGNRARLKIAITLSRKVPLIIMDEPLSGLDPIVREDILRMLASYVELGEQTIIISTHEVTEVEPLLDYVIFINEGQLVLSADVEKLRAEKGKSVLETMKEVVQ